MQTILDVIENVNESEGVKNHAGLTIDRLNTITTQEKQEREARERLEQSQLQRERQERLERERMEREKEQRIAEFHEWQQSHPDGTYTQWVLQTSP